MYCPSCDKSYGAVHSRCPECHSWLKVSAPANHRSKSAKSASSAIGAGEAGSVSTLDKESSLSWSEPAGSAGADWSKGGTEGWSDAIPAIPFSPPQSPATPTPVSSTSLSDPAPVTDSAWAAASDWGSTASTSDSWAGVDPLPKAATPLSGLPSAGVAPSTGWLGGSAGDDGWGGSAPKAAASFPQTSTPLSLGIAAEPSGWGGSTQAATPTTSPILGGGSLVTPSVPSLDDEEDGWSGGLPKASGAAPAGSKTSKAAPASQGWLGGADEDLDIAPPPKEAGWLAGETPRAKPSTIQTNGWLNGEDEDGPTMTEMVDRAIGAEEADDFVDDSWVDEETDGEFDDLGALPEYVPPTPEFGGVFLKMLLVAAVVLLIGGGVMFMGQKEKTPEELKAETRVKELSFARSSVEMAKNNMKDGKALLAVGPLEAAMTSLKTGGASAKEILDTKVLLGRALMKAQEYQKAYGHWLALTKAPEAYRKEAKTMMVEASKQLRAQATADLAEAATYIKSGEATSVITLGRGALKIYEVHKGTASQKGKAYGVIGRGYLNGKEYGNAKDNLKKARALNPSGGYGADLDRIAAITAPVNYYGGGGGYSGYDGGYNEAPAAATRVVRVEAKIDAGDGGYVKSNYSGGGGGGRSYSNPSSSSAPAAPAASVPTTKAIPAYQGRRTSPSGSSGRRGDNGVLPGYNSH